MIEYDYKIERIEDEKGGIAIYKPDKIPNKLYGLTYIEGPNSIGKSTLLDIIALGFHGLKNSAIVDPLKEKMNNLLNSDHQKLSFKLKLTDREGNINLISEKKSLAHKDMEVYELSNEGRKTHLSSESFERKYKLIYDIPNNPTKRLSYLINEIKYQQVYLGNKLTQLRSYLNGVISNIEKTDPSKLKKAEKEYDGFLQEENKLKDTIPKLEKEHDSLEKAVYLYYYQYYNHEVSKLKKELNSKERDIKKKTKDISKDKNEVDLLRKALRTELFNLREVKNQLSQILKRLFKKKEIILIIETWDELDLQDTAIDRKFDIKIDYCIGEFEKNLITSEEDIKKNNTIYEIKMYQDLVNLLENYKDYGIQIPGLDQPISEFIQVLNEQILSKQKIKFKMENIETANNLIDKFKSQKSYLKSAFLTKLKTIDERIIGETQDRDEDIEDFISNKEIEKNKKKLNDYDKKLKEYERKYNAKGKPTGKEIIPIGKGVLIGYRELTEEQLVQSINSLLSEMNRKKKKLIELENNLKRVKKRVDLLKKVKPHEYYSYLEFFKELLKVIESLNVKVNQEYRVNLDFILSKGTKRKLAPEKREKYNNAIFNYLGKVIGKVFHIEKEYNVRSINLLKGIIYTEEGTQIKFIDMGTGQSQSAYLKSLLSTSEDKIIIALFDEISSMDSKSLEPVYEKMRELYDKGKLLAALVVQRADNKVTIKNLLN